MKSTLPELDRFSGSWVISNPANGAAVELFDKGCAQAWADANPHFTVETAHEYLTRINREIRKGVAS